MSLLKLTERAEELQCAALFALSATGLLERVVFYGGTALRILYGLDRYSEDLDFSLRETDSDFDLRAFLPSLRDELRSLGYAFSVEAKAKAVPTPVQSAFLKADSQAFLIELQAESAKALPKGTVIRIKLEVDTRPPTQFEPVLGLVRQPFPFQVPTLSLPDLFAGKLFAALFRDWKGRVKGRDWYDVLWYLRKGVKLSYPVFLAYYQQRHGAETTIAKDQLSALVKSKIESLDWEAVRRDVAPFIIQPRALETFRAGTLRDALSWLEVAESGS
jgi:predicted nucleotidyltransferase component of viral defense system